MRLYEIIYENDGTDEHLIDTGEEFPSKAAFKKTARKDPQKYEGRVLELHPKGITRIAPVLQMKITFSE